MRSCEGAAAPPFPLCSRRYDVSRGGNVQYVTHSRLSLMRVRNVVNFSSFETRTIIGSWLNNGWVPFCSFGSI